MESHLKRYSFCGSSAFMEHGPFRDVWVQCSNVECKGFIASFRPELKKGEAAEIWNTCPREAELQSRVKQLENELADALDVKGAKGPTALTILSERVKLLEGLLHAAYPKVGPELAIAILEALRGETSVTGAMLEGKGDER